MDTERLIPFQDFDLDSITLPDLSAEELRVTTEYVEITRHLRAFGPEVTLKPRALPYVKVEEPRESASSDIQILLAGVVAPDLKDKGLREKFGGATPAETAKAIFLPGEIVDISREMSGTAAIG